MIEAVISTIILAFIAQILVYGYQFVGTQASSLMSSDINMIDDANNCMEYVLRMLDKNADQVGNITDSELAKCNEHCQQLSSRNHIKVAFVGDEVQLFEYRKVKGSWLAVTASDPNTGRSYTVKTLASYYDPSAKANKQAYPKRMLYLHEEHPTLDICTVLAHYEENQEYIPLPSLIYAKLARTCNDKNIVFRPLGLETQLGFVRSLEDIKNNFDRTVKFFSHLVFDEWFGVKETIAILADRELGHPHCFADGRCITTGKEYRKLMREAITNRALFELATGNLEREQTVNTFKDIWETLNEKLDRLYKKLGWATKEE